MIVVCICFSIQTLVRWTKRLGFSPKAVSNCLLPLTKSFAVQVKITPVLSEHNVARYKMQCQMMLDLTLYLFLITVSDVGCSGITVSMSVTSV